MIVLDLNAALVVAGFVTTVAVAWGAFLSVRSAANGPQWAFDHLSSLRKVWPALALIGVAAMFVFSPVWIGLATLYVVAALWFLSALLLRNLHRLKAMEGFIDIGAERRREIVVRARRFLIAGGAVMIALGIAIMEFGVVAWIGVALGAVLIATGAVLGSSNVKDR
jgi:hypothetical protein